MAQAVGIHDHPNFKTGLAPADPSKRILAIDDLLTGKLPSVPTHEDRFAGVTFALDKNDQYGTCGPTSLDNLTRAASKVATGTSIVVGWPAVEALYKQSGNPNFPQEDNGVEMGTMLDAALAHGFGTAKLVAFGKLINLTDANLAALGAIFGGGLWGQNLLVAQQTQTEAHPPLWDYKSSAEWGGHATYNGKFEPFGATATAADLRDVTTIATLAEVLRSGAVGIDEEIISWAIDVETTPAFRAKQLEEVFVPIFDFHLTHPAFLEGVDVDALGEAFHELTGKTLPIPSPAPPTPVPPAPNPSPTPGANVDEALWAATEKWRGEKHVADNAHARDALVTWGKSKGFK